MCENEPAIVCKHPLTHSFALRAERRLCRCRIPSRMQLGLKVFLTCVYGLCCCDVSFATDPRDSNGRPKIRTHTLSQSHKLVCVPFRPSIWRFVVLLLAFCFFFVLVSQPIQVSNDCVAGVCAAARTADSIYVVLRVYRREVLFEYFKCFGFCSSVSGNARRRRNRHSISFCE